MEYKHLTSEQRCQIYTLQSIGKNKKEIADHLGVSASTIGREIKRNSGLKGYRHKQADSKASERRSTASSRPTRMFPAVVQFIEEKLREKWSPDQISGVLNANGTPVSAERIYLHVWENKGAGGDLYKHLRHGGKKYNRRSSGKAGRGCIPNRVDIQDRPAIVQKKARTGDWEGDTIIGAKHQGAILSLVDRKSKYTKLAKLKDKTASGVVDAVTVAINQLPRTSVHTFTFDNGKEFSSHEMISEHTGAKCYFATPYCSWERGLNEHTNGLVRQYFPKSCNLSEVTKKQVQFVEDALNNRPRKVLGYRTPREVFLGQKQPQRIALQY